MSNSCAVRSPAAIPPINQIELAGTYAVVDVELNADTDWNQYCQGVLQSDLKCGKITQVDSGPDFIAGCQDEGRALTASH